jgi:outer membrane lipoprotein SlyB
MQNDSTTSPAGEQPSMGNSLQHSKALIAIVAVLGVTVMALAAALVTNRSDAQSDVPKVAATAAAPASKLVADTHQSAPASPIKHKPAPVVVAKSSAAATCADCGTVQSVTAVQRQGQVNGVPVGNTTIGLGTVAGGLLGGILGHQVGGGNGKTAATLLGVAGGAFAGNAVEKNMKKVTVYDVRVRMDDGSTRNMDISTAVPVGSKVIVEGKNLRLATAKG